MHRPLLLALALSLGMTMTLAAHAAPPPAYGDAERDGHRPAPPPASNDRRPVPPAGGSEPAGPVEEARRTAHGALERFEELNTDLGRAFTLEERDAIERRMMETMGEALDAIHRNVSPRQGTAAEQIYRIVEPAYKKAWLQRYEWKQEGRPERKRQRLHALNVHLRETLREVRAVSAAR